MKNHLITRSMKLPFNIEKVFQFFCDVKNLQRITPPELNFKILSPLPIEIAKGTIIDYQMSLFKIPFRWRSEICKWNPPFEFMDTQVEKGPYKIWEHTHRFYKENGNTTIEDSVTYRLPLWPMGEIAYPIVRRQLNRIFDYRLKTIKGIFLKESNF
ncbi:MAG: SRPBCC family protein [Proteobacteria bacterium]|nr:SRPBCC family protein [Pseudomonadota bacterium]